MHTWAKSFVARVILILLIGIPLFAHALEPEEVLVVANSRMAGSIDLALYYMEARHIPKTQLLKIPLTLNEIIESWDYDENLKKPVREKISKLREKKVRIEAVVLMYGVPLKIAPPTPGWDEKELIREKITELQEVDQQTKLSQVEAERKRETIKKQLRKLEKLSWRSSVDSELSLVKKEKYKREGWLPNPYFAGFHDRKLTLKRNDVVLVARLDGPDLKTVYRMIDDTLYAEKKGLKGKAYFDARWKKPAEKGHYSGYQRYDVSLHRAAERVKGRMPVVVNSESGLFAQGDCPDTSLYCGWYSLGRYVDAFSWNRGSIGYHMASAECVSLRNTDKPLWCRSILHHGAAATIGPVYEPYIQGFPLPELFFGYLVEGYMSVGEAYLVSLPYVSWQMVLVGDPLYQPFHPADRSQ